MRDTIEGPAFSSGMRGNEKAKSIKLRRISIEPAKEGFTVDVDYDKRDKKGEPLFEREVPHVFVDFKSLFEFLEAELKKAKPAQLPKEEANEA